MAVTDAGPGRLMGEGIGRLIARAFDVAIAILALVAVCILGAAALAPLFEAALPPDGLSAQGGHAFLFSPGFETGWPYVIPSHPDFSLRPGDIEVTEDAKILGPLEPVHDIIRERGDGRYNFWQGDLWLSSSDNTDPRTNGRSYGVRVKARLARPVVLALKWSLGALAALVLGRFGPAVLVLLARLNERWSFAGRARTGFNGLSRRAEPIVRIAGWVPLTFGRTFALFCAMMLGWFCWQALHRPMPLLFGSDSYSYIAPGVLWAAGRSVAEQSSRDIGYPALAALALRLGSLDLIPRLQLVMVVAGVACVLGVPYRMAAAAAPRLNRIAGFPRWVVALCGCAMAAVYGIMLAGHDLFVLDIDSAMAEAPHLMPTALALLLFVGGWTAGTPVRRLSFMISSVPAAYLSIMVKPHTLVVLALCIVSLGVAVLRDVRALRSPLVLALCAASAVLIASVHRLDAWVTPSNADFGPKTLFCNHLGVVGPVFDTSTPERAEIMVQLRAVLDRPQSEWPLMGFNGDQCMYGPSFTQALAAVAKAEGLTPAAWEQREFEKAVAKNPLGYARVVWKQVVSFLVHPVSDIDTRVKGGVPDDAWNGFTPYLTLVRMSRDQFDVSLSNWVPVADPRLASLGKTLLRVFSASFAVVTLGSTVLALIVAIVFRRRADLRLEVTMLAMASFTAAFVMTPALAHTFDVSRYLTDILPFSLLWWVTGVAYLMHVIVLLGSLAVRQGHPATAGKSIAGDARTVA